MTLQMFVVNFIKQLYVFIIPLFGIIFNVFYQVDCARGGEGRGGEGREVSSIANFSLTYLMVDT